MEAAHVKKPRDQETSGRSRLRTGGKPLEKERRYFTLIASKPSCNFCLKMPKRKPTVVDEMVPKSSGKKRRRCRFGEDCLGRPAPECGDCKHCLDRPGRGGPGTLKQKCLLRKCRLDSASGTEMDVTARGRIYLQ